MSEEAVIQRTVVPVTQASLANDLRAAGVASGDVLMVHCSLNALDWVCGGPKADPWHLTTFATSRLLNGCLATIATATQT